MDKLKKRIKQISREKPEIFILAGYLGVWICIALLVLPRVYGPSLLPDEFGYIAQAAGMAGMDWRETTSLYSYYSFGYGVLIFPFIKLFSEGIVLYRVMVAVNFLLLMAATLLVYRIMIKNFKNTEKKILTLVSGAAVLYVAYITYSQTMMAETLLVFLYILLAYGLFRWFQKPSLKSGMLVVLTSGYMYTVHMRTIGILLATTVCMAVMICLQKEETKKWRKLIILCLILIAVLFFAQLLKSHLIEGVGSESYIELTRSNDYSGQWGKVKRLFSMKGIGQFLAGLGGKIFYLGCASFGLYYWGMAFLFGKAKKWTHKLVKRKYITPEDWWYLWLFLSHLSALFISTVYTLGTTGRLDALLYGRYHENTIPFVIALGILNLLEKPALKKRVLWLIGLNGLCFFVLYGILEAGGIDAVAKHSITGIAYAVVHADYYDTQMLLYAYLAGGAGSLLTLGISYVTRGGKRWYGLLLGLSAMQLVTAFEAGRSLYLWADWQREDTKLLSETRELAKSKGEEKVLFLLDTKNRRPCLAQYILQDIPLHIVWENEVQEDSEEGAAFLLRQRTFDTEDTYGDYVRIAQSPKYELYYHSE